MFGATCTLCAIAKNEERSALEWLAYHRQLGFDRIVVYDHGSTDRTPEILWRTRARGARIDIRPWSDEPKVITQTAAYQNALEHCETEWLAFFDLDEFLVLRRHASIAALLRTMPDDAGAVAVNWRIFGSAGHVEAGSDLVTSRFQRCAPHDYFKHRHAKSIVRVEAVAMMTVHRADLGPGFSYRSPAGSITSFVNDGEVAHIDFSVAQLNHYVLKSRQEFTEKKRRGDCSRTPEYRASGQEHRDQVYWDEHDTNDVLDDTLAARAALIRADMKRLS